MSSAKKHRDLALTLEWATKDAELQRVKLEELDLRHKVIAACFGELPQGTTNCELERGYKLKAVVKPYAKAPDVATLKTALEALAAAGEVGAMLVERLVRWAPEISIGELKKLTPEHRAIIGEAIIITTGTPSLELKAPT